MRLELGPRRGTYVRIAEELRDSAPPLAAREVAAFETLDLFYRTLCMLLYNYAPTSGHPGGSISCGRIASAIVFDALDHDPSDPDRDDADVLSYAAGHKALGLYALWALRNEIARLAGDGLLPDRERKQLRLEDLLGFRRNPVTCTPLFVSLGCKALDGHPTPATPFVRLATGASGVGVASSLGLALGARDHYGADAPRVHILEGEGGMTPGRVAEALAAAGTSRLDNVVLHVDWNQASIDADRVCRDGPMPGQYVQWEPAELCYLHDWNVIEVADGTDLQQIVAAGRRALALDNGQPTAVVYRTVKGWRYGIEGRASHGAGHRLCSDGFFEAVGPLLERYDESLRSCDPERRRCVGPEGPRLLEECFWDALCVVRRGLEREPDLVRVLGARLARSRERLRARGRRPRAGAPRVEEVFRIAARGGPPPPSLGLTPGARTTLRGELARVLQHYNAASGGALLAAAADLLASTSVDGTAAGFAPGTFDARDNPDARLLSLGGICEDAIAGIVCGLSDYGRHIGVGSSYAAFLAALGHVPARLHAIGNQADGALGRGLGRPAILICAHAGLKTGEDGPTHADPQALQLVQGNFPAGAAITLTPWEPQELWPLVGAALRRRPALLVPFVTRPEESVPDRAARRLAPADRAVTGLYALRRAEGAADGVVVLQGSGVTLTFVEDVLPRLDEHGIEVAVYYVASAELFDALPPDEQRRLFPERHAQAALGITDFTLPTLDRWVRSERGRAASLHPFRHGRYPGSGPAARVLEEAGLDGASQYEAIVRHVGQPACAVR
jgi:transketolase